MRKILCLIAALIVAATGMVFANGAKESAGATAGPQTVTIWGWWAPRMKLFQDAGTAFTKMHPDIKVEVTTLPTDTLWQKAVPAFAAGNGPSLLLADAGKFYEFQQRSLIDPYSSDYFPADWVHDTFPNASWDQGLEQNGKFYDFAAGYSPDILVYNKSMFAQAGLDPNKPPQTWDELVADAQKLTKRDASGNLVQAGYEPGSEYFLLTYVYQEGGNIVKSDGSGHVVADMTNPAVTAAFQWLMDLYTKYKVTSRDLPAVNDALGQGKVAMSIASSWVAGDVQQNHPDVFANLAYANPPTPSGNTSPSTGRKDPVLLLMVNANRPAAEKAASQLYLRYIYRDTDTFLKGYASLLGIAPAKKTLFTDPDVLQFPAMKTMIDNLQWQKGPLAVTDDLTTVFNNARDRVLLKGMSVNDSLKQANVDLNALIQDQPDLYDHLAD